jgi:hypothetical protein
MAAIAYERSLDGDFNFAMREGSLHLDDQGKVHESLRRIVGRLDELAIPYAVVGGMALFRHGFRRFTEDVDILVSPASLALIHEKLDGLGYLPPFTNSKHLRDTSTGVRIEFLVSGQFPGDGKPKPVAFPDPQQVATRIDGISYISLPAIVELKLASGMSNVTRAKDIGDVVELIRLLKLDHEFAEKLNAYVVPKFRELVDAVANDRSQDQE